MKDRKLEYKDIAGNLPHDLHIVTDRTEGSHLVYAARTEGLYINGFDGGIRIEFCKAVLRPESDLYRTITHNGEEIIPIVELAKMAWSIHKSQCEHLFVPEYEYVECYKDGRLFATFSFINGGLLKMCYPDKYDGFQQINQYLIFDYLHELKIDYRGLIDTGRAIDCNTLENNPYK